MTPSEDENPGPLSTASREVVRAAIVDLVSKALGAGLLALGGVVVLLVVDGGSVPAWIALLVVIVASLIAWRFYRRSRTLKAGLKRREDRIGELEQTEATLTGDVDGLNTQVADLEQVVAVADNARERHIVYANHITEMLDHLQRVVAGDIDAPLPDYIQRGILEPAKDVLTGAPEEDVRLSVLLPDDDGNFTMAWTAGHSYNSQSKYQVPIAKTLARLAFENGDAYAWDDVTLDDRYEANPRATRPIHAMISMPLRRGDAVVGVFNCIASVPDVFDSAEHSYVASLTGVLNVAVNVWLDREGTGASSG